MKDSAATVTPGASSASPGLLAGLRGLVEANRIAFMTAGVAVAGTAAVVSGTMSTFSSTETRTQAVTSALVDIGLADGTNGQAFSSGITGLAPGDFAHRLVTLTNSGNVAFDSLALSAAVSASTDLTAAANPLTVTIKRCTADWTVSSGVATCADNGIDATAGSGAVIKAASTIAGLSGTAYTNPLNSLASGGTDRLLFEYSLPSNWAGSQSVASNPTITYSFVAGQSATTYR